MPLMDVLMSVLTFFIIISMTLTGQQVLQVTLPTTSTSAIDKNKLPQQANPLFVGLTLKEEIILDNQPVNSGKLADRISTYIDKNPQGKIILSADRKLPYSKVSALLKKMGEMGGVRVSLLLQDK